MNQTVLCWETLVVKGTPLFLLGWTADLKSVYRKVRGQSGDVRSCVQNITFRIRPCTARELEQSLAVITTYFYMVEVLAYQCYICCTCRRFLHCDVLQNICRQIPDISAKALPVTSQRWIGVVPVTRLARAVHVVLVSEASPPEAPASRRTRCLRPEHHIGLTLDAWGLKIAPLYCMNASTRRTDHRYSIKRKRSAMQQHNGCRLFLTK